MSLPYSLTLWVSQSGKVVPENVRIGIPSAELGMEVVSLIVSLDEPLKRFLDEFGCTSVRPKTRDSSTFIHGRR